MTTRIRQRDRGRPGPGSAALVLCAGLLGLVGGFGVAGCDRDPRPVGDGPHVILISIDTLRADRMSVYGHARDTTPALERLAEESVVFERAYHNGGGTLPSHMTMMTSLHPRTHWVLPSTGRVLPADRSTLAEVFHRHGWDTAAFVDGGWMASKFGFGQGFDVYSDARGGGFEEILPKAEDWLEGRGERPVFLFLHSYDVHSQTDRLPYECPDGGHWRYLRPGQTPRGFDGCRGELCASELLADLDGRLARGELRPAEALDPAEVEWMKALYDGCVHWTDRTLGEFLEALRKLSIYDDALIVVTSDHGEEFLDHGRLLHHQNGFDELARVPLIVKLPAGEHGGRRTSELAALVDLMPTLLEYARLPSPDVAQGFSLRPVLESTGPVRDDLHIFAVLRNDRYKFFAETGEVYDLTHDASEKDTVAELDPQVRHQLKERLWQLVRRDIALQESLDRGLDPGKAELTDEERRRLEALGYLAPEGSP